MRQPQQPDEVGYRSTIFAGSLADIFVAEAVLTCESVEGLSDFDRIQIFALNVLDQGDFKESVCCEILDYDRYLSQALLVGRPSNGVRRRQADICH